MRFAKRDSSGGTSQRWKLVEELELGEPMEGVVGLRRNLRSSEGSGSLPRENGLKGKLS